MPAHPCCLGRGHASDSITPVLVSEFMPLCITCTEAFHTAAWRLAAQTQCPVEQALYVRHTPPLLPRRASASRRRLRGRTNVATIPFRGRAAFLGLCFLVTSSRVCARHGRCGRPLRSRLRFSFPQGPWPARQARYNALPPSRTVACA